MHSVQCRKHKGSNEMEGHAPRDRRSLAAAHSHSDTGTLRVTDAA